jgi:hypothetical protein
MQQINATGFGELMTANEVYTAAFADVGIRGCFPEVLGREIPATEVLGRK